MHKQYCVYILTNQRHTVLYTGVTSELKRRIYQHREKLLPGFTNRYNVSKLVYYVQVMLSPPLPEKSKSRPVHAKRRLNS